MLSGLPFNGPIGAARVGYLNGEYVLNPTNTQLAESLLDLVVAGTAEAVLMVESEAKILSEDIMLGAVVYGHEQMQAVINAVSELKAEAGKPAWDWTPPPSDDDLNAASPLPLKRSSMMLTRSPRSRSRYGRVDEIKSAVKEKFNSGDQPAWTPDQVKAALNALESKVVRGRVTSGKPRIDGRDTRTVRPIQVRAGVLPRTHGSALFTRGETQALAVVTLGTGRDAQIIDALSGEFREPFMLHYNFPPYCVGETSFMLMPKRREIGHGKLARRGGAGRAARHERVPVRPANRVRSHRVQRLQLDGDGVRLEPGPDGCRRADQGPVAGVAMGLVKEGDRYAVLTDILGDEDHLGDMDFKVAGTDGVTALQMDIKINGITREIMSDALAQARDARLHILGEMNKVLGKPREKMSDWAPTIMAFKIDPEKIREVIGKGGSVIRQITEETGATIDIDNDGTIRIASVDGDSGREARRRIDLITADVEVGQVYDGKVARLMDFGAFVTILPGKDGLVHISQISDERVERVSDKLKEGDVVRVKVLEVDRQGRIRLSMRDVEAR
jgi:polyribonucleotide nucleotidyltransferase